MSAKLAVELFERQFGGSPDGVWAAPGRVNLIGEHTDYNAGLVLPIALPQCTYVAARPRSDSLVRLASQGWDGTAEIELGQIVPGNPSSWARYPAGVLWALQQAGYPVSGLEAAFVSEVPTGAGLSSSAAIEGAVAVAASDLFGLRLADDDAGRSTLADLCRQAENEIALAPTGGMDQAAALRSRAGFALYLDCRDNSVAHVPFDPAGHVVLVINTRVKHQLGDGQYGARRDDCAQVCALFGLPDLRDIDFPQLDDALAALPAHPSRLRRRVKHVVTEIERVRLAAQALSQGDLVELGQLWNKSHQSMRDDYEISSPELDTAVEATRKAGALGARMTGGGFGGSAIALIPEEAVSSAQAAVTLAFARAGYYQAPEFLTAIPSGGATKIDNRRDTEL
ncbi:MAG: galactokinase [Bifidobacteriaceae bacterium]|jgi:galactokinase|nr:galactokinase [Bifidobacteriaceae bacterium]